MVRAERNRHLKLKSKMTLRMAPGATLKMFPTAVSRYAILKIANAEDVNVIGGTLQGDRLQHKGRGGEWGMGIFIGNKLLTTANPEATEDEKMLERLGLYPLDPNVARKKQGRKPMAKTSNAECQILNAETGT